MTSAHYLAPDWPEGVYASRKYATRRTVSRNGNPPSPGITLVKEKDGHSQKTKHHSLSTTNVQIAAFPKCFMDQLVVKRSMSLFESENCSGHSAEQSHQPMVLTGPTLE